MEILKPRVRTFKTLVTHAEDALAFAEYLIECLDGFTKNEYGKAKSRVVDGDDTKIIVEIIANERDYANCKAFLERVMTAGIYTFDY